MKIRIPIRLESAPNKSEHWATRYKRNKRQVTAATLLIKAELSQENRFPCPCTITLTRIAPRKLDFDNLVASFKAIQDIVAAHVTQDFRPGRADSDSRITWKYEQQKGKPKDYAVEIQILPAADITF